MTDSAKGDCYLCVPPGPSIEAAALGASESAAPGTGESAAPGAGEFALSGTTPTEALHTFTIDSGASRSFFRDITTLTPISRPIALSLADPYGAQSLRTLPRGADLQDAWVDQFTPGGQRVTHCTCSRTGRHLATFTRRPGSSLYTLTTASPPVATSRSSPAYAPCSCRPLSHETLFWHHRLGHPSLPRLRGMASRTLVSDLPRSLPPLPPGPAPTCVPCVEGRQRAAPHSSSFPPTEALLQTLHMDVWGPARVRGQGHERYFLLVVDDYSRYTTVFPLRSKDRGGEFSSDLLRAFCRAEGIRQTFTLLASPQQNGIAERCIGMYAAHQIKLQPRVSLLETTPTILCGGRGRLAMRLCSVFCVWGSRAFVRDTSADKLSSRAVPCVFLGFPPDAPGWLFYHPTSRRVLSSQDVTFDESVSYYHPAEPVEVAVDSGATRGAELAGAVTGGAEPGVCVSEGAEPGGAEPERVEPGGAEPGGAESGSAEPGGAAGAADAVGAAGAGGAAGADGGARGAGGAANAGAAGGAAGAGVAGGARAVATGGASGAGAPGGKGAGGVAGVVAGDPGAEGTGAVSAVSGGAARPRPFYVLLLQQVLGLPPSPGPTPPLLSPPPIQSQSQLQLTSPLPGPSGHPSRSALPVRTVCAGHRVSPPRPPLVRGTHSMTLRPSTAPQRVPLPSPHASSLPDGPDPESDSLRAASPTVTRFLATTGIDPLFESTAASALVAELVDFAAACRLDFATSLVAESMSSSICPLSVGGECALGTDVLEDRQEEFECFAAAVPHLVSMLLAPEGDPDAPDIPTPRSYAEAIEGPYSSQWRAAMDAEMASWKSTGTYVDELPPPGANIVSGMWIFRVKRPPGSPPVFKARYVARGFNQRQGVDFFQTFSPTPKMTTLRVLLHVAAQRDYELHLLDFSTAFLQGSVHEEIWLRPPPSFTGSFPAGTQWSLRRRVYGLRQAPREWHDTLRTTLAALDDLVFATTDTEALAHVKSELQKRHTCTDLAPPSDESVEPSGPYPELVGCLMYLMNCTRPDLAYPLSLLARYVAPGSLQKVHWDAAKRVLRYLCSTSGMGLVLGGRARVVLTGHADASWELRWLTYLLTDLGEAPRSPPVLYVDNKAMLALCEEHRLEHRTKHIPLRYFLAQELQQRGQLRLAYVASQANTADVFTKALQPCDHQPCFAFLDWSCDL
ncbi:unnamed protein product, partial [Closterium sp. NIES-53]